MQTLLCLRELVQGVLGIHQQPAVAVLVGRAGGVRQLDVLRRVVRSSLIWS